MENDFEKASQMLGTTQNNDGNMESPGIFPSFLDVIEQKFQAKKKINPSYSLRAFSRDLRISVSQLSEIRSGKYGISAKKAAELADRLGLSENQKYIFSTDVKARHSRKKIDRKLAIEKLSKIQIEQRALLSEFQTEKICTWQHFAVLEYLRVHDCKEAEPNWLESFGLKVEDGQKIIQELRVAGVIEKNSQGLLRPTRMITRAGGSIPSRAIRNLHRSLLVRSIEMLETQSVDSKQFGAVVLPVNPRKISEAKALIQEFQEKFLKVMGSQSQKSKVYCLGVQFFSLENEGSQNEIK